jgi:hypothetical protein
MKDFEETMNRAAKNWLNQDHAAALDDLNSARELFSGKMPLPKDAYSWNAYSSLKIYAVLLSKLVEIDYYQIKRQTEFAEKTKQQAKDWAMVLRKQGTKWRGIRSPSQEEEVFRKKWIKRFYTVIVQVNQEF